MKISECDNSLITVQKQTIIIEAKQRSALANYIRPKQRFTTGRIQYAPTVRRGEKKTKHQKCCHFCYFCNLTLVKLSISQLVYSKNKVTKE